MATGSVYYWNGISGWIKQTGVENMTTLDARDVMVLQSEIDSGTVTPGCTVTFTIDQDNDRDPWKARDVIVS